MAFGYSDKLVLADLHRQYPRRRKEVLAVHHANIYGFCAAAAERYMREYARPEEIATLIAENNEDARYAVKKVHYLLRGKGLDSARATYLREFAGDYLPVSKIVDCVHFVSKDEAILLQLADACAFIFRRYLKKNQTPKSFSTRLQITI
jgi:hypothetical protein